MMAQITPAEYVLGAGEVERARLIAQCEIHRSEAERLVDRIGVGTGWRAIDIGCGPLGVLDILADRVGSTGTVTGLDRETRFLEMATRSIRERGLDRVALRTADATATGLPDGAFDLVHERLVLINVSRPQDVVTEMARLATPGGWVAVQDVDWISWTCQPEHPSWHRLAAAVAAAWVGDVFVGRRLPGLLRDAGLVDVAADAHIRIWSPGDPYQKLLLRFAEIYRARILAGGTLTEAELDDCVHQLDVHLDRADTFTLYPTFFQAWGRKP
ncbi:MAG: methyltransferase domain-containing protein [Actinomycetota bacterium]|nr:methyltransferase domain-containing protein [Actinomycetota bacterium]